MSLPITSLTALALGLWLIVLTVRVVLIRRRDKVVIGDNGDRVLAKAIRAQGNLTEQAPMALIVMGLAEVQGAPMLWLPALLLVLGRLLHGLYFGWHGLHWRLRFWGMWATVIAQGLLLLLLASTLL